MPDGGRDRDAVDHDVVVVGGGPTGCAAGIFAARYGLDTLLFDRGPSSIRRCAFLENYPGFPGGIDVETFEELVQDHVREAGCRLVTDLVESVDRPDGDVPFVVRTRGDREVTARRVVAATRYGGEYLRPLDGDAMFVDHDGAEADEEHFDRSYAEHDGSTPVDGLFVAAPAEAADRQAVVAAGRGARVGLAVVAAARREDGLPGPMAKLYDWVRRDAELDEEWRDRDRWRAFFDDRLPDDHDLDDERRRTLREREIDRRLATYRTEDEVEAATERGQRRLLEHLDDDLVVERARAIESARSDPTGGA